MSILQVDNLSGLSGTDITIEIGKAITGAVSQFKITGGTAGQVIQTNGSGGLSFTTSGGLPTQTGNTGKYLTTDGTNVSWEVVDHTHSHSAELPSQTGQAGEYLQTDGTTATWEPVATDPAMGGDLTGTASNAQIVAGSIGTTELANNSVTSDKIGVDVIVAEDIAANAITVAELQDDAVTTAKIATDAVTANEIAAGAVTTGKIARAGTSGQVLTSAGTGADATWAAASTDGILHASMWHLTGYPSGSHDPLTTWAEMAQLGETYHNGYKRLGGAFTHASGVFTFPATGYWQVMFKLVTSAYGTTLSNYSYARLKTTQNNGTTWHDADQAQGQVQRTTSANIEIPPLITQTFFHVDDTSTHKTAFEVVQHNSSTETYGVSNGRPYTCVYFTRLAGL